VTPNDQVTGEHAVEMDAHRHRHVANIAFASDEGRTSLLDHRSQQPPENKTGSKIGYKNADILIEDFTEHKTKCCHHDTHAEGQPEWAKSRTTKALLDVMDCEGPPNFLAFEAMPEVQQR